MELLLVILNAAVVNNYVLTNFIGINPLIQKDDNNTKACYVGVSVTFILVVSSLICFFINQLLINVGFAYLKTFVFAVVILLLVFVCQKFIKSLAPYCYLTLANALVLGITINIISANLELFPTLLTAFGAGLGFLLLNIVVTSLFDKIDDWHVPNRFKGLPIRIIVLAIIAMVIRAYI